MPSYSSTPTVTLDIPRRIAVGVTTDFSAVFTAGNRAGTSVNGVLNLPTGNYTAEYYDTESSSWQTIPLGIDNTISFTLADVSVHFRVTFNEIAQASFSIRLEDISGNVLSRDSVTVYAVTGETIDELNERIASSSGSTVRLETDVVGTMTIGTDVTIDGNGHVLHGNIRLDASSDTVPYKVVIQDLIIRDDDGSTSGYGIVGMNQTATDPVKPVDLTLRDCQICGHSKKGAYLTNVRNFNMNSCTIGNVSTADMGTPNIFGDYAIDLNVCGVQGGTVKITGNTFTESCGDIGAVKVTQRGGIVDGTSLTDDVNTDILNTTSAYIQGITVSGNDFTSMNEYSAANSKSAANVVLGSSPNSDGTARTYCNSCPALVGANGTTYLNIRGGTDTDMTFTLDDGATVSTSSALSSDGQTYQMAINISDGVEFTGTLRDGASFSSDASWTQVEGGPCGIGMLGFRRFIIRDSGMKYVTGGFSVPGGFTPIAVLVNMSGGADAFYDSATERVILYRNGTELDMDTEIDEITILMFGK